MLDKETITRLRKEKKLTGQEVADAIGISYKVYQTYESGVRNAGLPVVEKLADFYGVTTDYLLGREPQTNPLAGLNINVDNKKFIDIYQELPDYQQKLLVDAMLKLGAAAQKSRDLSAKELRKMITKKFSCLLTSAGTGEFLDDENIEMREFPDSPQVREADIIIPVDGNSMEPAISDGDELCVKLCDDIEVGEIGVFIVDGKGYVKEKGKDRLISINEEYDDIFAEEYRCVGKVIGKVE